MSILDGNTLELHYSFDNDICTMDAFVQNRCEYEFLGVLKEVVSIIGTRVTIETEASADGSVRKWFKIIGKEKSDIAIITRACVAALATGVFVTPITTSMPAVTQKVLEKIFEDPEFRELAKRNNDLEELRTKIIGKSEELNHNSVIKRKKSNFYAALKKYPRVRKVSFAIVDEDKNPFGDENSLEPDNFQEHILVRDDLEPTVVDATIEIISPVLKERNLKWVGIHNKKSISFRMKSEEFRKLVQEGDVQFRNGTTIDCTLEIRKKIDNEGVEKIVAYEVVRVNSFYDDNNPATKIPDNGSSPKKKNNEPSNLQLDLFASLV